MFGIRSGFHLSHTTGTAHTTHTAIGNHRNPGRIVAAIFQPLQPFHQDRDHITVSNGSYDSTHAGNTPLDRIAQFNRCITGARQRTLLASGRTRDVQKTIIKTIA